MEPVILIGQAPSRTSDPAQPLSGGSLVRKLSGAMGVTPEAFLRGFERRNLLGAWPGRAGKGDAFPMGEARRAARGLLPGLFGRRAVLLGRRVAEAFGAGDLGYFEAREVGGVLLCCVPHPSGINRWWNDPVNRRTARRFLRRLAAGRFPRCPAPKIPDMPRRSGSSTPK